MKIEKKFTKKGHSPYEMFTFTKRKSQLKNPDGSVVFEANDIEVPNAWSQVATDILAQKYFRKTGVPQIDANGNPILDSDGKVVLGSENSLKQVVHRLAFTWRWWGEQYGYFESELDAQNFYDEVVYMLLDQMAAPNSPQWFNTGLSTLYGIKGNHQGHYYVDPDTKELKSSEDAYSRPQPHACFINSVHDDLLNKGGIFDLVTREARVFKFGSGSGTNFSDIRAEGEKLSGGGISSGLMSFLKIFDRAAGAIKSGGTTRRAAKMVILDVDHPDIENFIDWKAKEENKVAALVAGSRIINKFMKAIVEEASANGTDTHTNKRLSKLIQKALNRGIPLNYIKRYLDLVSQGFKNLDFPVYDTHYESEAYNTVSGQNSNNSVRVSNDFMKALTNEDSWDLKWRTNKEIARTVPSKRIWDKITMSAWQSADPGLQFDTTINEWHTCPKSGRINASNPCSEYMFLDDTACNLASLNLMKFFDEENQLFKVEDYLHAIRIWTLILEISVLMAHYPSAEMAQNSYDFRTLGLGYANLGTLLMVNGIPYDSPEALAWTGAITALLTGESYATSAEISKDVGPFEYYNLNKDDMLRVIRNHRRAAYNASPSEYEGLSIRPMGINPRFVPDYLVDSAREIWDRALVLGEQYGFRNAQVTVLAPTGTIGLIMDCDTTGIEPDFAIVKFKKLAGGGYFKIVNQSVRKALRKLEFTEPQITEIENYAKGHGTLVGCPHINNQSLIERGFTEDKIELIENQLPNVFDIRFAFNKFTLGEDFLRTLGLSDAAINSNHLLKELGFNEKQIEEANDYICGTMMLEGAPHLTDEILPIFDTASKCGKNGKRYIEYMAHVKIMSAAQPFISGAISKTVNMPAEVTVAEIGVVYTQAWKQMLKAIAIYRDSSKLSQPLNTKIDPHLVEEVTLSDDKFENGDHPVEIITNKPEFRRPVRQKLPPKRHGNVREAVINTHKVYIRTGEYADGTLGEIFIDMYKEGAAFRGLLNSFAILVSKALQYGIPLEELVDTFTFTRFEPSGIVQGHERIKNSTSVLDFIFRSLAVDYLNREDLAHVPAPETTEQLTLEFENQARTSKNISEDQNKDSTERILTSGEKLADIAHLEETDENISFGKNDTNLNQPEFNYSEAISLGFTGEQCDNCGSMRVKKNGTCSVCLDCGHTTGCS